MDTMRVEGFNSSANRVSGQSASDSQNRAIYSFNVSIDYAPAGIEMVFMVAEIAA